MKNFIIGLTLLGSFSTFATEDCNIAITGWTTGNIGSEVREDVEILLEKKGYNHVLNGERYSLHYETFDSSPDVGGASVYSTVTMTNSLGQELIHKQIEGSGIVFFNKPKKAIKETTIEVINLIPTCEKLIKLENL